MCHIFIATLPVVFKNMYGCLRLLLHVKHELLLRLPIYNYYDIIFKIKDLYNYHALMLAINIIWYSLFTKINSKTVEFLVSRRITNTLVDDASCM